MQKSPTPSGRPPLFVILFVSIFGFIGIAVLISVWTADGFGAPPLFFRVFASFIALGFIFMGFGMPIHMLRQRGVPKGEAGSRAGARPGSGGTQYDCPNCGANIQDAVVSPSGDIRCSYCHEWWNIHRK